MIQIASDGADRERRGSEQRDVLRLSSRLESEHGRTLMGSPDAPRCPAGVGASARHRLGTLPVVSDQPIHMSTGLADHGAAGTRRPSDADAWRPRWRLPEEERRAAVAAVAAAIAPLPRRLGGARRSRTRHDRAVRRPIGSATTGASTRCGPTVGGGAATCAGPSRRTGVSSGRCAVSATWRRRSASTTKPSGARSSCCSSTRRAFPTTESRALGHRASGGGRAERRCELTDGARQGVGRGRWGRRWGPAMVGTLRLAGCDPVVFVGGEPDLLDPLGADVVADMAPGEGPLGGVVDGTRPLRPRRRCTWWSCRATCRFSPPPTSLPSSLVPTVAGVDVVVGRSSRPQPLCAVWSTGAADRVRAAFERGTRSILGVLDELATEDVRVAMQAVRNINTLDDLDRPQPDLPGGTMERSRSKSWPRSAPRPASSTSASPTNGPPATFRGRCTSRSATVPEQLDFLRRHADLRHLQGRVDAAAGRVSSLPPRDSTWSTWSAACSHGNGRASTSSTEAAPTSLADVGADPSHAAAHEHEPASRADRLPLDRPSG